MGGCLRQACCSCGWVGVLDKLVVEGVGGWVSIDKLVVVGVGGWVS